MGCSNFLSYSQRLVAFIDLLGFSDYIKESDIDNISNLTNQADIKMHLESNGYTCRIVE